MAFCFILKKESFEVSELQWSKVIEEPEVEVMPEPAEAQVDKPWYKPVWTALAALVVSYFAFGFLSLVAVVFGVKGIRATDPRTGEFKGYILSFVNLIVGSAFFAVWSIGFITVILEAINGAQ